MHGNQLKRSQKTDFSSTTAVLSRERSFIKPNRDPQKRRSQTLATLKGKPSMEIYRPPNVRTDGLNASAAKLNVHAKEFTMNNELLNSKSSTNLAAQHFEPIPLQHSKSSGHVLRHMPNLHPSALIPIISTPITTLPLLHSHSTHAMLNHIPRVNFQLSNDVLTAPLPQNNHVGQNLGIKNWNQQSGIQPFQLSNIKRSKSLTAADSKNLASQLKDLAFDGELELNDFPLEIKANIKTAVEDPNKLPSRTLMDLVKIIIEKVIEGIRYSEAGAKLCMTIIEKEKNQTFLESLVNTCQQLFQDRDKLLRGVKIGDGTRFTAFMWFLTEMCGKLKRHKRQCQFENIQPDLVLLSILAKCCQACVSLPIKCLPETECLFFVLTSIGRDLENELPAQLEQLVANVRDAFLATVGSSVIRKTLLQLIELHASNWQLPGSSVLYYYPRIT